MASFIKGRPVTTTTPFVTVETRLKVGKHRFQLVIVDDKGVESAPAELEVTIGPRTGGSLGRKKAASRAIRGRKKATKKVTKKAVRKKTRKVNKKTSKKASKKTGKKATNRRSSNDRGDNQ